MVKSNSTNPETLRKRVYRKNLQNAKVTTEAAIHREKLNRKARRAKLKQQTPITDAASTASKLPTMATTPLSVQPINTPAIQTTTPLSVQPVNTPAIQTGPPTFEQQREYLQLYIDYSERSQQTASETIAEKLLKSKEQTDKELMRNKEQTDKELVRNKEQTDDKITRKILESQEESKGSVAAAVNAVLTGTPIPIRCPQAMGPATQLFQDPDPTTFMLGNGTAPPSPQVKGFGLPKTTSKYGTPTVPGSKGAAFGAASGGGGGGGRVGFQNIGTGGNTTPARPGCGFGSGASGTPSFGVAKGAAFGGGGGGQVGFQNLGSGGNTTPARPGGGFGSGTSGTPSFGVANGTAFGAASGGGGGGQVGFQHFGSGGSTTPARSGGGFASGASTTTSFGASNGTAFGAASGGGQVGFQQLGSGGSTTPAGPGGGFTSGAGFAVGVQFRTTPSPPTSAFKFKGHWAAPAPTTKFGGVGSTTERAAPLKDHSMSDA